MEMEWISKSGSLSLYPVYDTAYVTLGKLFNLCSLFCAFL